MVAVGIAGFCPGTRRHSQESVEFAGGSMSGMTWEQVAAGMAIISIVLQGINLYITACVKLWAVQTFVSKSDFLNTLEMWSRADSKEGKHG
jgi:hypothetical protein